MAIIIDPTLTTENLAAAVAHCAAMPEETVWVCLSPSQARYLSDRVENRVEMLGGDWPLRDRLATRWLYREFHEAALSRSAIQQPWPKEFPYDLNLPRVFLAYAAHEGVVYWFVLLLLERYGDRLATEISPTMIGASPFFFAAVETVFGPERMSSARRLVIGGSGLKAAIERYLAGARKYLRTLSTRAAATRQRTLYVEPFRQNMVVMEVLAARTNLGFFTTPFLVGRKLLLHTLLRRRYREAAERLGRSMKNLMHGRRASEFPSSLDWDSAIAGFVDAASSSLTRDLAVGYWTWKMLDARKPAAVLCYTWFGVHRHFMRRWCLAGNRKFIVMQHGFGAGGVMGIAEGVVDADLFLTWGVGDSEAFIDVWERNREAHMVAVGNPLYGATRPDWRPAKGRQLVRVLVAPSAYGIVTRDLQQWFWDEVEIAVSDHSDLQWTVRTHPRDAQRDELLRRFRHSKVSLSSEAGIMDAMRSHDLVVTTASTVALDAMAGNRPAVIVNHPDWPERFSAWDAGILVRQPGELSNVLAAARSGSIDMARVMHCQDRFRQHFGRPWDVDATLAVLEDAVGP